MKQITVYEASDGQLFKTKEDAVEHEEKELIKKEVEVFLASEFYPYKKSYNSNHTLTRNIIAWEKFKKEKK
jgi:hypothetical protein